MKTKCQEIKLPWKKLCASDDAGHSEETYCLRVEPVDQTQKNYKKRGALKKDEGDGRGS